MVLFQTLRALLCRKPSLSYQSPAGGNSVAANPLSVQGELEGEAWGVTGPGSAGCVCVALTETPSLCGAAVIVPIICANDTNVT